MAKWKFLLGIGILLIALTIVAHKAFPKQTVWTGEYIEIYEGRGAVKEYRVIPDEANPDWVKDFQRYGIGALVGGLFISGFAANKIWGS